MHHLSRITFIVLALVLTMGICSAQAKDEIRVSGQPCLHGLPTWWAIEDGWTKDKNIDLTYTLFPSGAPQVEALAADQWDVGAMGTVPTMMAILRYGAKLIAISNDESETNDLWVRPDSPILKTKGFNPKYPEIYGKPEDWKGKKILVTTVSTVHYALDATLKALGLTEKDVEVVNIEQGQAVTAFASSQGDVVCLWAPFSYTAESKGWKKVSSGARSGAMIPGGVVVRKDFAEKHPDLVVEWLDLYMTALDRMRTDKAGSGVWLNKYFAGYCGLQLPESAIKSEFELRPIFSVEQQVKALTAPDEASAWMKGVADFFAGQGRITKADMADLEKSNFGIDASFMKKVQEKRAAKK